MLVWNNRNSQLGVPIQLIQNNRYMSRWLVAPANANQSCADVLSNLHTVLNQASYAQGWPWSSLSAYSPVAGPQIPGWPSDMISLPYQTPGACPILLDGVWGAATTPVQDSSTFGALPGFFPLDLFNATTQQKLVEAPKAPVPASGPCNPADLTFDFVTGIFRCAGQIIITPTDIPPVQPSPEKKEEKPVWPWVAGGAVLLVGGVYLLAK